MDNGFWAKVHGGVTHFPIGLVIAALVFDGVAFFVKNEEYRRDLLAAGFWSLMLAALGACGAVLSGLLLAGWQAAGSGPLLDHHVFVWTAFGLVIAIAVWRIMMRKDSSEVAHSIYLAFLLATAVMMAIAGYWGGEMVLGGG